MSLVMKKRLLGVISLLAVVGVFALDPIAQDPRYHAFSDVAWMLGVPNFWNVASNIPFLFVGAFALWRLPRLTVAACRPAYWVLSVGVGLVAMGSAYYHYAPANATLFWDRLPMTLAFMALFAMLLQERVWPQAGGALLWSLVLAGLVSALYWTWTESQGYGDLRPYVLVQFLPMVLMPLIVWWFPQQYLRNSCLLWAFVWYVVAKLLEHFDASLHAVIGVMGGHPLKHVAAAIAAAYIVAAVPVARR